MSFIQSLKDRYKTTQDNEHSTAHDDLQRFRMRTALVSADNDSSPAPQVAKAPDRSDSSSKAHRWEKTRHEEITDQMVAEIIDQNIAILTIQKDSSIFLKENQRDSLIVFEDGTFIVSKAASGSVILSDIRRRAESANIKLKPMMLADVSQIKALYGNANNFRSQEKSPEFQKKLFDLIKHAASLNASDIHIKLLATTASIHFTIKGEYRLQYDMSYDEGYQLQLTAFNACNTGDTQLRPNKPNSSRLTSSEKFQLPAGVLYLRLEFTPLDAGKTGLTMRIAYNISDEKIAEIDSLGYEKFHVKELNVMRRQATGIIIISGPTGSGKSTTLKTALEKTGEDRDWKAKIVTIEDPPEFTIKNAWQIPIESGSTPEEKRANFSRAMSSMLRMAPNIGMVGEIRDGDGARLSFDMAKTGHLVWGTLHANSAPEIITRLRSMALDSMDLCDPALVRGLIAQRLIKSVCRHCSHRLNDVRHVKSISTGASVKVDDYILDYYQRIPDELTMNIRVANKKGCKHCDDGYVGRKIVAEVILPTRPFLELMMAGQQEKARDEWIKNSNGATMLEHAFIRVIRGEIDPHDVTTTAGDITISNLLDNQGERLKEVLRIFKILDN
jgi:general secretion pathway protein E